MKKITKIIIPFLLTVLLLSGCHGTRGLEAFEIPERFDEEKQYEITFWAKNDTNKTNRFFHCDNSLL